jgi:putative endonuclease
VSAFVYILASRPGGAIYIGATTNLRGRVTQHRLGAVDSHTRRYRIHRLVYFETHQTLELALARERKLKRWRRAWKDALIAGANPMWRDLAGDIPL